MAKQVYLIGLGPGYSDGITPEAISALNKCEVIISPEDALPILSNELLKDKKLITDKMSPVKRSELAIQYAEEGFTTTIVALGHPGFFAIASTFYDVLKDKEIDVTVIPGMTMIDYATAKLGSPLGRDYAVVSIADQASPWEEIKKRAFAALDGDFVLALYNPLGKLDDTRLKEVVNYAKTKGNLVVGLFICVEFGNQKVVVSTVNDFPYDELTVASLVVIGNSYTINQNGRMITPRPYLDGKGY